jgi:hypothetical protein
MFVVGIGEIGLKPIVGEASPPRRAVEPRTAQCAQRGVGQLQGPPLWWGRKAASPIQTGVDRVLKRSRAAREPLRSRNPLLDEHGPFQAPGPQGRPNRGKRNRGTFNAEITACRGLTRAARAATAAPERRPRARGGRLKRPTARDARQPETPDSPRRGPGMASAALYEALDLHLEHGDGEVGPWVWARGGGPAQRAAPGQAAAARPPCMFRGGGRRARGGMRSAARPTAPPLKTRTARMTTPTRAA